MNLSGKAALVTGGAVRVGKAIALALAAAGADVVINYHSSADAAIETVAEIEALGRRALAVKADVSQGNQVQTLVDAAVRQLGRLDVLVNSASLWRRTPWAELDEAAWDQLVDIALKGPFLCARAAAPHLTAHGDGAIVNIVDLSAIIPFRNYLPHSAAKAGLLNLTYSLAMELAPAVRVNAIAPGPVLPPPEYTEQQVQAAARRTLIGRWGTAEDVAQAAVFLTQAPYITGVILPVDGGERLAGR
ncbi:MAG: SDR family oxidoreductase [Anaerolineae bacterium]|jgi:NAD(P)-dependent dehydrogenase (short-subunit alcohol dehydrogenase family)|nr:SDR family oxidoreductase [Anaerolineae bacterium]